MALGLLAVAAVGCASVRPPGPISPGAQRAAPDPGPGTPRELAQAHLDRGHAAIAGGDMAEAATVLRAALRLHPDLAAARASLGLALYAMGDVDSAVVELRGALARQPEAVQARLTLAAALVARQEWAAARLELEQALQSQADSAQAHYTLGVVRYALGDLPGAIEAYRHVLALDPRQPDARYNLALVLKLAGREAEATAEFLAAAEAGLPRAQYFVGAAYANGVGVERNLPQAVMWWTRAAEQGVGQAAEALADLRQVALGGGRRGPGERDAVEAAFREARVELWKEFPDLARDEGDSVGAALLRHGRVGEAVPVLIREAAALDESAQRLLETLYEQGVEGQLSAHDPRILRYLESVRP